MASFSMSCSRVKSQVAELEAVARNLRSMQSEISRIGRSLSIRGSVGETVRRSVRSQAEEISEFGGKASGLASGLNNIVSAYTSAENTLCSIQAEKPSFDWSDFIIGLGPSIIAIISALLGKKGKGNNPATFPGKFPKSGSVSWQSGSLQGAASLLGMKTAGTLYGELFGASYNTDASASMKIEEKDGKKIVSELGAGAEISGEVHALKGKASGSVGYMSGSAEGTVGKVSGKGSINATLVKDGKFMPQISAKASVKATGAEGSLKGQVGTDENNIHGKASGEVLTAEAKAEVGAGKITYKNGAGETKSTYGVKGTVGAEAYVASGKASGGFSIFGIEVNVGVSGHVGGAGGKIGGYAGAGGVSGHISAGLGVGVGLDISIDWSNFKWFW